MSRRMVSIGIVLSLLLFSLLVLSRTKVEALTPTPTALPPITPTSTPGADFVGTPLSGTVPLTVQFTAINPSVLISCTWTFGDGASQSFTLNNASFCPSTTHIYTTVGSYSVSLSVRKVTGAGNGMTKTNYIQVVNSLTPTATPTCVNPTFVGHVYDAVTGQGISGATVTALINLPLSQTFSATTDGSGAYSLFDPYGCQTQSLVAAATGYASFTKGVSFGNPNDFMLTSLVTITPVATNTPTATITPTVVCIPPTPEALRVSPVLSPSTATTQVITVTLNKGSSVTITSEAGSFSSTTSTGAVFSVTINLLPNTTNHLQVRGTVNWSPVCPPYTLSTSVDTSGNPLTIVQVTGGSLTSTPTRTPTPTVTPTPHNGSVCSPVTATITAPFTFDGAGRFCWQIASIPSYANNWNLNSLTINGVNFTGVYVAAGNLPAKINGFYYIGYTGNFAWSHFEAK